MITDKNSKKVKTWKKSKKVDFVVHKCLKTGKKIGKVRKNFDKNVKNWQKLLKTVEKFFKVPILCFKDVENGWK